MKYLQIARRDNPFYRTTGPHVFLNLILVGVVTLNAAYLICHLFLHHPLQDYLFLLYP